MRAPLNPILGETIQRALPDGTKYYAEQTSHHPPLTNFYLEGPDECYRFSGYFEIKAWLSGWNSIQGTRLGRQVMSFKDGGLLTIKDPGAEISGITFGDRIHNIVGEMTIVDHINKLELIVTHNPPQHNHESNGMFSSLKSKLFKKKSSNNLTP